MIKILRKTPFDAEKRETLKKVPVPHFKSATRLPFSAAGILMVSKFQIKKRLLLIL